MPKEFYTERDIEDMFKRGVMSLERFRECCADRIGIRKSQPAGTAIVAKPTG